MPSATLLGAQDGQIDIDEQRLVGRGGQRAVAGSQHQVFHPPGCLGTDPGIGPRLDGPERALPFVVGALQLRAADAGHGPVGVKEKTGAQGGRMVARRRAGTQGVFL